MTHKGLIYRLPEDGDYIQGGRIQLGGLPIRPDGQWDKYLSPEYAQDKYLSAMDCTSNALLNCVEALERQEFGDIGFITKWSRRFLAKVSKTTQLGNDPHTVAEALRNSGAVFETDWPYTPDLTTWGKFYAEIPMGLVAEAQAKFKAVFDFGHQWVKTDPASMIQALQRSPLTTDVYGWNDPDAEGIEHREGRMSEHDTCVYGHSPNFPTLYAAYIANKNPQTLAALKNEYWKCRDSYFPFDKKLAWDFGFQMVKEYTLWKQVLSTPRFTWYWIVAINWIRERLGLPILPTV